MAAGARVAAVADVYCGAPGGVRARGEHGGAEQRDHPAQEEDHRSSCGAFQDLQNARRGEERATQDEIDSTEPEAVEETPSAFSASASQKS